MSDDLDMEQDEQEQHEEIKGDIDHSIFKDIIVYSRDWTIETIITQMSQGNIELNPRFQRRNVWNDERRSLLIESLLEGMPVPEIVLAEDKEKKRAFIVLDGKQRLLTIAGFSDPSIEYWGEPRLSDLTWRTDLNGVSFAELEEESTHEDDYRALMNADIRCTIITGYTSNDVLYDVFYRLNTGSVSLSTQELRQVLNKGPFADYLIDVTNKPLPLQQIMGLSGPDKRMRDTEILLRCLSFVRGLSLYRGNLKQFLDDSMADINDKWETVGEEIREQVSDFNRTTTKLIEVFEKARRVGRKCRGTRWEGSFNRALFEVEYYYFQKLLSDGAYRDERDDEFRCKFSELMVEDGAFRNSVEQTTKSLDNYRARYRLFEAMVNHVYGTEYSDSSLIHVP